MPARPMSGQVTQIQKETTPGTAVTTAMKRITGLRMIPAFGGEAEPFAGLTGKVATSVTLPDLIGEWSVEGVQDFNAIGYVASSRIATPVTTTPGGGTLSRQHVFTLNPNAADAFNTYTAQFGDATLALQGAFGVFQSLGITVERGNLDLTSSFISREPATATLASAGVTVIPTIPIPPRNYDVWIDSTWAGLGTTKALAAYRMNVDLGDKYETDAPINSAVTSYESVLEAQDQNYAFDAVVGFDTVAQGLITNFKDGSPRYFRLKALGPIIETTIAYSLQIDFAAFITGVGEIGPGPNSSAVTIPFDMALASDGTNSCVLTLVNTLTNFS